MLMMLGLKAIFPEICILTCSLNTVHPYTESCLFVHNGMYRLKVCVGARRRDAQFVFLIANLGF